MSIIKTKDQKLAVPYKVTGMGNSTKDVDLNKRTVSGIFNSFFFIDSDLDMLLPGCASKSIAERGVGSTKGNKIKHLKDHDWTKNLARIDVLDERKVELNGKVLQGIYHESYYSSATDSQDQLIKIQEGLYDARSIGYRYMQIVFAEKDSINDDAKKNWDTYLPLAINPEKADEFGFFWVVKEIMLFEGSDVTFGANELTPLLGIKGINKDMATKALFDKIDIMDSIFRKGNLSDEGFHQLDMEKLQIKTYISELMNHEPSIKDTILADSRSIKDTQKSDEALMFYKSLLNQKK